MRSLSFIAATVMLTGCVGSLLYKEPNPLSMPAQDTKEIGKSRDAVWNAVVPELEGGAFVISSSDKASGLVNISYSGNPEKYVDCGRIDSFVRDSRGKRTYEFPAARAQQTYEAWGPKGLFEIDRRVSLVGRVTLIFEEISPDHAKVTAITRYVVRQQSTARLTSGGEPQSFIDTFQFNSGSTGQTAKDANRASEDEHRSTVPWFRHDPTLCAPTGQLEREILDVLQ